MAKELEPGWQSRAESLYLRKLLLDTLLYFQIHTGLAEGVIFHKLDNNLKNTQIFFEKKNLQEIDKHCVYIKHVKPRSEVNYILKLNYFFK